MTERSCQTWFISSIVFSVFLFCLHLPVMSCVFSVVQVQGSHGGANMLECLLALVLYLFFGHLGAAEQTVS